jgi:hypothetical protein
VVGPTDTFERQNTEKKKIREIMAINHEWIERAMARRQASDGGRGRSKSLACIRSSPNCGINCGMVEEADSVDDLRAIREQRG